jgi:hypothetical protein
MRRVNSPALHRDTWKQAPDKSNLTPFASAVLKIIPAFRYKNQGNTRIRTFKARLLPPHLRREKGKGVRGNNMYIYGNKRT